MKKKPTQHDAHIEDAPTEDAPTEDATTQDARIEEGRALYLRVLADFQNYKRRIAKERMDWMRNAKMSVLKPMLTVLDDIDRAIEACASRGEEADILAGLELTKKNIEKTFKDLGVTPIDSSGQFDPELHEALLHVESADHTSGEIVAVMSKGYLFDGQGVRHAQVSVAK